jgi:hypothetical protein
MHTNFASTVLPSLHCLCGTRQMFAWRWRLVASRLISSLWICRNETLNSEMKPIFVQRIACHNGVQKRSMYSFINLIISIKVKLISVIMFVSWCLIACQVYFTSLLFVCLVFCSTKSVNIQCIRTAYYRTQPTASRVRYLLHTGKGSKALLM